MDIDSYIIKTEKSKNFDDYLILLYKNNLLIGYCSFIIRDKLAIGTLSKDGNFLSKFMINDEFRYAIGGLLASLYIKEEYRGKKLGKELILYRISFLKNLGITKLFVESNGKFTYHDELYKGLDEKKILTLEKTDSQTYHYLSL